MQRFKKYYLSLASVAAIGLAACSSDEVNGGLPGGYSEGMVDLSLNIGMPVFSRAEQTLPAEQIHNIRIVIVDLGIDSDGNPTGSEPFVEYNKVSGMEALKEENGYQTGDKNITVSIPRIYADRRKKIYLLVNCEPEEGKQSYLNIRTKDGGVVNTLDQRYFVPDNEGNAPIDLALIDAPIGSFIQNDITTGESLAVPMTAVHKFTVPTITEIAQKYPTVNAMLTYPIPEDLYVVKTMNKIRLIFHNKTNELGSDFSPLDLWVKECTLTGVNHGDSFMFAKPDESQEIFKPFENNSINAPWIQWLYNMGSDSNGASNEWIAEFDMPQTMNNLTLKFAPKVNAADSYEGIRLPAPVSSDSKSDADTRYLPVYFPESKNGDTAIEMAFTVAQKLPGSDEWTNEYSYSIKSKSGSSFYLPSLFRSTDVVMEVTFKTGVAGVYIEVQLLPYTSVDLNPGFGL